MRLALCKSKNLLSPVHFERLISETDLLSSFLPLQPTLLPFWLALLSVPALAVTTSVSSQWPGANGLEGTSALTLLPRIALSLPSVESF